MNYNIVLTYYESKKDHLIQYDKLEYDKTIKLFNQYKKEIIEIEKIPNNTVKVNMLQKIMDKIIDYLEKINLT